MKKIPTKQIYLLGIIVIGLVTLSVYSTYALFSLESSTSNVVSINTPNSLIIPTGISEYRQVIVPKNSYITTDIDIYNNFDYEVCYSIWYKVLTNNASNEDKIKVYENTAESLTTGGSLETVSSKRIHIIITNDNDIDTKVNFGVVSSKKEDICNFNLTPDKKLISTLISNPVILTTNVIDKTNTKTDEEGYLTYKNSTNTIDLSNKTLSYN